MTKRAIKAIPMTGFRVLQNKDDHSYAVLVIGTASERFQFLVAREGMMDLAKLIVDAAIKLNHEEPRTEGT